MDWEPHRVWASREEGVTELAGLAEAAHDAVHRYCSARAKRATVWDGRAFVGGGAELPRFHLHGGVTHYREPSTGHFDAMFRCESVAGSERLPPGIPRCAADDPRPLSFALHVPQLAETWVFDERGGHFEATLARPLAPGSGSLRPYLDVAHWRDQREPSHDATAVSGTWSVKSGAGAAYRLAFDDVVLLRDRGERCATARRRFEVAVEPEPWWSLPGCGLGPGAFPRTYFEWTYRTSEGRTTVAPSFADRGQEVVVDAPWAPGLRRLGRGVRFEATVGGRRMRAVDGALHLESSSTDRYALAAEAVVFVAQDERPCVHVERMVRIRARRDDAAK